jgi:hypothetical protein
VGSVAGIESLRETATATCYRSTASHEIYLEQNVYHVKRSRPTPQPCGQVKLPATPIAKLEKVTNLVHRVSSCQSDLSKALVLTGMVLLVPGYLLPFAKSHPSVPLPLPSRYNLGPRRLERLGAVPGIWGWSLALGFGTHWIEVLYTDISTGQDLDYGIQVV